MSQTFSQYLHDKIAEADAQVEILKQSERKDEANLVKVRANIYNVCKTIYETGKNKEELQDFRTQYLEKLEHLRSVWDVSYQTAKMYDDVRKIVVEEIKIETLCEIKKIFLELMEVQDA